MEKNFTTGIAQSAPLPPPPYAELLTSLKIQLELNREEIEHYERCLSQRLPPLVKTEVLALALGISHKLLYAMVQAPQRYYRSFSIPKRTRGKRQIDAPRVFLRTVQKWILRNVLYSRELPPFVTGFVPGRGLLNNARAHVGQRYLMKLDIQDFFASVNFEKVEDVFKSFEYPEKVTRLLTHLCTFRRGLPQGAPTSPYLANLGFLSCDNMLKQFSDVTNLRYTRYADDLTFSANEPIPASVADELTTIIRSSGFQVNPTKFRSWHPGQRLITTGMVVNEKAQPTREFRRRLRAIFHQASLSPHKFRSQINKLVGWAAFVNMYDGERGREYLKIARSVGRKSSSLRAG